MTSINEEATWANLQNDLEEKLSTWNIDGAGERAKVVVRELRRTGWRTPLPERRASRPRQRPVRTEATQRHIAACREAIRSAARND